MKKVIVAALISGVLFSMVSSCNKEENEVKVSKNGGMQSHNTGQNCMSCHKSGGSGEGRFVVAGTIYKADMVTPNPNVVVKLYTEQGGAGLLKATLYVDAKGNFYTTEAIDLTQGLYPYVVGNGGSSQYMSSTISSGACNSCHGVSTDKLWVD